MNRHSILHPRISASLGIVALSLLAGCSQKMAPATAAADKNLAFVEAFVRYDGPTDRWAGPATFGVHVDARQAGQPRGITSVCSAHPIVIEAALRAGKAAGSPVLIEATCNQVNQEGGYTGMTPAEYRDNFAGMTIARGALAGDSRPA